MHPPATPRLDARRLLSWQRVFRRPHALCELFAPTGVALPLLESYARDREGVKLFTRVRSGAMFGAIRPGRAIGAAANSGTISRVINHAFRLLA